MDARASFMMWDATKLGVKNAGAAGRLDGSRFESIRGQEWKFAQELRKRLQKGSYRAGALRRVYIPKKGGKEAAFGHSRYHGLSDSTSVVSCDGDPYTNRFFFPSHMDSELESSAAPFLGKSFKE